MLILIVVAAAIALAAFVASYEKQVLAEESQSQQRSLESLKILSITPNLNVSGFPDQIGGFTFVLASEYINPSQVSSISLNGQPLKLYWALDIDELDQNPTAHNGTTPLILGAREEVVVTVCLVPNGTNYAGFSLFDDSFSLTTSDYIELSLYTELQNTFTQVFIPPTAIAVITSFTSYSSGGPVQLAVLDGTDSFQPGANGTIVSWTWEVTGPVLMTGVPPPPVAYSGSEVEFPQDSTDGTYFANLTVTNTNQLAGEASVEFNYTAPT